MNVLHFLKVEGSAWDSAAQKEKAEEGNNSNPKSLNNAGWEVWLIILMFITCWVIANFVRDKLAMLVCDGLLFIIIVLYPLYRKNKYNNDTCLITYGDIGRIFMFVVMGLRLEFTAVPWLGGLFWIITLIAPLIVLSSGAAANKGRFFLHRGGTCFVAIYLALNLWNDLWVYSNYSKGLGVDLREQTISLPVSADLSSDKKYKAIALFRVKSMSNTGGLGGCIERLLFSGSGPAIQKDCCDVLAASEMGDNFSKGVYEGEGCYSDDDDNWLNPWSIKPKIEFPYLVSFLHHLKKVGASGGDDH